MTREWYANAKSLGYFDKKEPELQNLISGSIFKIFSGAKSVSTLDKIANHAGKDQQYGYAGEAADKKRPRPALGLDFLLSEYNLDQLALLI